MGDRVFTGDTLLIRGTGRTDFQNGDSRAQYESIFSRLLRLPDETLVYPGARLQGRHGQHDRRGEGAATRACRCARSTEYVDADGQPQPAQPEDDGRGGAGQHAPGPGAGGDRAARLGGDGGGRRSACSAGPTWRWSTCASAASASRHGSIPGSLHAPYPDLQDNIRAGGMLHELAAATGKRMVFYCAFGERSAMAVQAAQDAGIGTACHIHGGIAAWKAAGGPLA